MRIIKWNTFAMFNVADDAAICHARCICIFIIHQKFFLKEKFSSEQMHSIKILSLNNLLHLQISNYGRMVLEFEHFHLILKSMVLGKLKHCNLAVL